MLTVPEAAARVGRSAETIRRWIRSGRLSASKIGTQHLIEEGALAEATAGRHGRASESALAYGAQLPAVEPSPNDRLLSRIAVNRAILGGKPCVRGTRISVELILEHFASGWTEAEVLENYPSLTRDDLRACFAYARRSVESILVFPTELDT